MKKLIMLLLVLALPAWGASYQKNAPDSKMDSAILSALGQPLFRETLVDMSARYVQLKIATADVLLLNTTPIQIVATPGAGMTIVPVALYGTMDYNSATYATNSNEDLELHYGPGGGNVVVAELEETFMESAVDVSAYELAGNDTDDATIITSTAAGIWVSIDGGDPTTGDSDIYLRFYYRLVPTLLVD